MLGLNSKDAGNKHKAEGIEPQNANEFGTG